VANHDIPPGVGQTALGVARMRARESERADRLFEDPYAGAFVAAAPEVAPPQQAAPAEPISPGAPAALGAIFQARVAIRTRFYDDYLLAACAAGCRQVVLLAAGMDTRDTGSTGPPAPGCSRSTSPTCWPSRMPS
jgi:methyltransferase (TIGR00027 family)